MNTTKSGSNFADPASKSHQSFSINFHGTGNEYFKIWIVNVVLSVLTLGIYSAWAKVRRRRYLYGNTEINDSVFEYHATPIMILKGRLIAVGVFVGVSLIGNIYPEVEFIAYGLLALVTPWVIWRSLNFNARMTSYANVHFSFIGKVSKFYLYVFFLPFAPIILAAVIIGGNYLTVGEENEFLIGVTMVVAVSTIYLLVPYIQSQFTSYIANHYRYGQGLFKSNLKTSRFYTIYLKLIGLSFAMLILGFLIIIGYVIFVLGGTIVDLNTMFGTLGQNLVSLQVIIILVFIAVVFFSKAYLQTRIRNYVYGNLAVIPGVSIHSNIELRKLMWIFVSNTLMLLVTLGLAYPWTLIRLTRYKLETIRIESSLGLDRFVTQMQKRQSAIGEEIGEAFDMDFDLGM